jgi:hypothetical protein
MDNSKILQNYNKNSFAIIKNFYSKDKITSKNTISNKSLA